MGFKKKVAMLAMIASAIIGTSVTLTGCAGVTMSGKSFDTMQVNNIQKGKTTKQEIRKMFGIPVATLTTDTGETWNYSFQSVGFMNERRSLDIDFNKAGVVTDFKYEGGKSVF